LPETIKSPVSIKRTSIKKSPATATIKRLKPSKKTSETIETPETKETKGGEGLYKMKGKQYSQQKRHAYKLDSYGRFGNLFIDGVQLMQYNKLVATDNNGNIVMIKKVDPSLIELLKKKYNKNKKYSESAKKDF